VIGHLVRGRRNFFLNVALLLAGWTLRSAAGGSLNFMDQRRYPAPFRREGTYFRLGVDGAGKLPIELI
jgi:hypothetical protein